jgi:hypothetical protein
MTRVITVKLKEKDLVGNLVVDGVLVNAFYRNIGGRIILKWFFVKWDGRGGGGMHWIDLAQVTDCCECSNEPSGSIKCGEFLD